MTKKIFRSILIVAAVVLLASLLVNTTCLYEYFGGVQEGQLKDELALAADAVEHLGQAYLEHLDGADRCRLTWVQADGTVLYDTQANAADMEDHSDRQEIQQALTAGEGSSVRYSATLLEKTIYAAKRLDDGSVLRISIRRATAANLALGMLQPFVIIVLAALILSALLAGRISKRIVEPLNRLDLEKPLENDTYEELSPLLNRLNQQQSQIRSQILQLQRKNDEFAQVTGNMKEGLVLLGDQGVILSINHAARQLFHAAPACVGQDFLTVDRSIDVDHAVRRAMAQGHSEIRLERDGREYQLDVSRIESNGSVLGAVLLSFDVTEEAFAQRNRREFTANVSHELKTPLQSIMGSAELLENGLVKPEDQSRFVGRIRTEAARLVTLIEDILHLSQLDEGREVAFETVDLLDVSREAAASLAGAAKAKNVTVTVTGDSLPVPGIRRLLTETVFNLCDNAVKYNVEGGKMELFLREEDDKAVLSVKDTGIGIPAEHQSRVFERFYRVDKSHSKASGGTGLGLSIVKHAVQYMNGTIELASEPGKGTTITLRFPKSNA